MDEDPVRSCIRIEGVEVTGYRLTDARADGKEIASLDRLVLAGQRVQFLCAFSVALHTARQPDRFECPVPQGSDQCIEVNVRFLLPRRRLNLVCFLPLIRNAT